MNPFLRQSIVRYGLPSVPVRINFYFLACSVWGVFSAVSWSNAKTVWISTALFSNLILNWYCFLHRSRQIIFDYKLLRPLFFINRIFSILELIWYNLHNKLFFFAFGKAGWLVSKVLFFRLMMRLVYSILICNLSLGWLRISCFDILVAIVAYSKAKALWLGRLMSCSWCSKNEHHQYRFLGSVSIVKCLAIIRLNGFSYFLEPPPFSLWLRNLLVICCRSCPCVLFFFPCKWVALFLPNPQGLFSSLALALRLK